MTVLKETLILWTQISDYWKLILALTMKEWAPGKKNEDIWAYSDVTENLRLPKG